MVQGKTEKLSAQAWNIYYIYRRTEDKEIFYKIAEIFSL